MTKIFVVGDSHSNFYQHFDYCSTWEAGPFLAYNLIDKPDLELSIRTIVPKDNILLFCFGEIDVRVHLKVHNNISECSKRYINFVKKFADEYKLAVIGPIASTLFEANPHEFLDIVGTCLERNKIARELTLNIRNECLQHKIFFGTIIENLIDDYGLTKMEYYDNTKIHLNKKAIPLMEPLLKEIIND